jgi:hypothetical protein
MGVEALVVATEMLNLKRDIDGNLSQRCTVLFRLMCAFAGESVGRVKYSGTGLFQFAICDRSSLKLRLTDSRFAIALG